jgi:hypothetical protein
MSEHLRDRLHEEMSGQQLPPADDLVARAVAGAVRTRRGRRTASGLGTVAVVGLTVLAVTVGSQLSAGSPSASSAQQAGAGGVAVTKVIPKSLVKPQVVKPQVVKPQVVKPQAVATEATPSNAAGTVDGKLAEAHARATLQASANAANPPQWTPAPTGVPATPQGELQLFADTAAAYGNASHFAVSDDADQTHVKAYLTTPDGKTGMLQFSLYHDTLGYAADCLPTPAPNRISCHHTEDGGYVIKSNDHAGCVNAADITVVHPDGTAVWITLASCLTNAANQVIPGAQTLTTAEAEAIFQDPGFDFTMPADVVARGTQNIGTLATFW